MATHEFNNQATQAERREVLRNDTYFARQQNTIDDAGGRYAKLNPAKVTGSTPTPYPQQPASSPWSQGTDQTTGVEPPFGIDVNELPSDLGGASSSVAPAVTPSAVEPDDVPPFFREPVVSRPVVNQPATMEVDNATGSPSMKRRW